MMMIMVAAIELSKGEIEGIEIEFIEISELPMLNTDLEINGTYPPIVEAFRQKILQADSILFASPEYNYSVTGTIFLELHLGFVFFLYRVFIHENSKKKKRLI